MPKSSEPKEKRNSEERRAAPKKCGRIELPTSTRLNVTVKKLHISAEWKWTEGGEDTCGICRMEFEAACTNCKFPGDDCPLVLGTCRHAFHRHCIDKWAAAPNQTNSKPQCPLCRQEWGVMQKNNETTTID